MSITQFKGIISPTQIPRILYVRFCKDCIGFINLRGQLLWVDESGRSYTMNEVIVRFLRNYAILEDM